VTMSRCDTKLAAETSSSMHRRDLLEGYAGEMLGWHDTLILQ
jgi:hypothetical protein